MTTGSSGGTDHGDLFPRKDGVDDRQDGLPCSVQHFEERVLELCRAGEVAARVLWVTRAVIGTPRWRDYAELFVREDPVAGAPVVVDRDNVLGLATLFARFGWKGRGDQYPLGSALKIARRFRGREVYGTDNHYSADAAREFSENLEAHTALLQNITKEGLEVWAEAHGKQLGTLVHDMAKFRSDVEAHFMDVKAGIAQNRQLIEENHAEVMREIRQLRLRL
eukprot:g16889.t1